MRYLTEILTIEISGPSKWDKTRIHGVVLKAIFGGATGTSAAGASSVPKASVAVLLCIDVN